MSTPLTQQSLAEFYDELTPHMKNMVNAYTDSVVDEGKSYLDAVIFPFLTEENGLTLLKNVLGFFGLEMWDKVELTQIVHNSPRMDLIFLGERVLSVQGENKTIEHLGKDLLEELTIRKTDTIWKTMNLYNALLCYQPKTSQQEDTDVDMTGIEEME